jgi:apolipoprotein N-acyltransferase
LNINFWKNREILSPDQKKNKNKERLLLIISGILLGISFPPFPFPFQLLMFFGLSPYFYVIEKKTKLIDINRSSYLTFFILSLITLYWVGSWQKNADPFLMISGVLLIFVNPLFLLIPSTLFYFFRKIFPGKSALYLFPLFWVTYEYAYMITDASFPWLTLGSGLSHFTAFIQIADIIGTLGLSLVVVLINVLLYKAFIKYYSSKKISYYNLSAAVLIYSFILVYGFIKINGYPLSNKKIRVGLIQPNIDPWEKWDVGNLNDYTKLYLGYSRKAVDEGAKLIVWPETAFGGYLLSGQYDNALDSIYNFVRKNNVYLLTGMPDIRYYHKGEKMPNDVKYSSNLGYYATYNAIYLFSPDVRIVQKYGKMKLVPFGERVPFVDQFPFLGKMITWGVGISGWNVGKDTTLFRIKDTDKFKDLNNVSSNDTIKIDGLVCYESIYPVFVSEFVRKGAQFITVVTNDSWYGNSSGPYQHKEMSVLRAVENRRSVIRAANGGISCFIDPLGRTINHSEMFTRTFLVGDVTIQNDETFFTRHAYLVPVLCSVFSIWIIGMFILFRLKKKFKL